MPIKDASIYPKHWKQFSEYIRFDRAKNRCERCGIRNYAVGHYEGSKFVYYGGSLYLDETSHGFNGFKESKELFDFLKDDMNGFEHKPTMIVLTVAHLDRVRDICDCQFMTGYLCANPKHVKAMCQKCHNNYDVDKRRVNREKTLRIKQDAKRGLLELL